MTKDAVSDVSAGMVLGTLIGYLVIYATLIVTYIGVITYLARKATKGESTRTRGYPRGGAANVTALQPGE
jgi:cytochrome d ubiquinol oxidase subunit I